MSEMKHTGDPLYEVTADGRVFSVHTNWRGKGRREMTIDLDDHGYPSVRIIRDGKRRRIAVHRLVAEHYLPPRPSADHEVRHLDGDKSNNAASNLAWGTRAENASDRERHGRTSRGEMHSAHIKAGIRASANQYWRHAR